jgi:hypothetical protein
MSKINTTNSTTNENTTNTNKVVLSHPIVHVKQYSNAWLIKCGCGELFTGKGVTYPIAVRKHLFESAEVIEL